MNQLYHVSSSPHVRSRLTTGRVMYNVLLSLLPAALMGIAAHGLDALLVMAVSVLSAWLAEGVFDYITKRPNTLRDGSAAVTGLLLALCLPASVPLYVPCLGSLFAILVVKCFFGGLGHNFMNPALAGRCFLLISFSGVMTNYTIDGVSSATPLAELTSGGTVDLVRTFLGFSSGVTGSSIAALLLGGIYLLATGGITFEIPAATLGSFVLFMAVFGGQGFDPAYLAAHICGGSIIMGAFFMATDPVTSPVTSAGQLVFGLLVGVLAGLFRVWGSTADSVSYAIIIANMAVPLIDEFIVPKPFGYRERSAEKQGFPKPALVLCVITLLAGVCLSGVYSLTKDAIAGQRLAAKLASYQEVCPGAAAFEYDSRINAVIEELDGGVYGSGFGRAYINEMVVGTDSAGNIAGYVISATSGDANDGTLTVSVGLTAGGTVSGIAFTEMNETPGLGSLVAEEAFSGQFSGVKTDRFILNKAGGAAADNEIDGVTGATVSSQAVVNAVNAALDFYAANVK